MFDHPNLQSMLNRSVAEFNQYRAQNPTTAVDLSDACFWKADLSGANFSGVSLVRADMYGANLREANLVGANLQWANLVAVDFSDSNLTGAVLHGANLWGAKGLPAAIFNQFVEELKTSVQLP